MGKELAHTYSAERIVNLTGGDASWGLVGVLQRIPTVLVAFAERHKAEMIEHGAQQVFRLALDENWLAVFTKHCEGSG